MVPPILWVVPAVTTLLSLLLAVPAPASAGSVSSVGQCPSGDRSYSSVGARSMTVTAPDGYRISSFCVVGRGNAGPEVHTLDPPQTTATVRHSSGRQLDSCTVTYVRAPAPVPSASETETTSSAGAGEEDAASEATPTAQAQAQVTENEAEAKKDVERSAPAAVKSESQEASVPLLLPGDGEELQVTTFEEKDEPEDRLSFVVVGGIIAVGLLAGAIALTVRLPGQR